MIQINPYLVFNGNCREVMIFYQSCLEGELMLQTIKESEIASEWPKEMQDNILHASLVKDEMILLLASDMAMEIKPSAGDMISLSLTCRTENEITTFFSKLSAGGKVTRPLHDFFAGTIGALTDQFGINWLLYRHKS